MIVFQSHEGIFFNEREEKPITDIKNETEMSF